MKMRFLVPAAMVLAVRWVRSQLARATSMVSMSMEQLTEASSDIVQAQVIGPGKRVECHRTQKS